MRRKGCKIIASGDKSVTVKLSISLKQRHKGCFKVWHLYQWRGVQLTVLHKYTILIEEFPTYCIYITTTVTVHNPR